MKSICILVKAKPKPTSRCRPRQYKLTMQFANSAHQSYGPELSKTINVTVK